MTTRRGRPTLEAAMDLELAGETAVVFGAASGLGAAIARAFAAERARVVLADVAPAVTEVARELAAAGADARAEVVDATDFAAVRELAGRFPADHLVYAAGAGSGKYGFPFWNREKTQQRRNSLINYG